MSYTLRPSELPRQQHLLGEWWAGDFGRRYAAGWVADVQEKKPGRIFTADATGEQLATQERYSVRQAEPYWVSEEMMTVADHASATLPDFRLREAHLPTPTGFMYFAAPHLVTDARDRVIAERVVCWTSGHAVIGDAGNGTRPDDVGRLRAGVSFSFYSGRDDEQDWDHPALSRKTDLPSLVLFHVAFWPYGVPFTGGVTYAADGREISLDEHPEYDWRRFLATVWQLVQQPFVRTRAVPHDRPTAKFIRRHRLPDHPVRVITLRRTAPATESEAPVEPVPRDWQRRWVVSGHWRRLHTPTRDGREVTWVNPYVKGPEDKPLVFGDHVYAWRR